MAYMIAFLGLKLSKNRNHKTSKCKFYRKIGIYRSWLSNWRKPITYYRKSQQESAFTKTTTNLYKSNANL